MAAPRPSDAPRPIRLGVDIGGTKIEIAALDADHSVLVRHRVATPRSYAGVIDAVVGLVAETEAALDGPMGATIGVGAPGAISRRTGLVKNANSTWLNGMPLDEDLATALGRPIRIANDADCLALSEARLGAGQGVDSLFAVILGTGVGGGLVFGGQLIVGPNRLAGEWGHNPLPWATAYERPGTPCHCGRRGCIETFLSGEGLAREHLALTGVPLAAAEVAAHARAGRAAAVTAVTTWTGRLAKALAAVVNVVDPDVIVVGGGLSQIASIYDDVPALWSQWVFGAEVATPLVPAALGDSSGVLGAALLWES